MLTRTPVFLLPLTLGALLGSWGCNPYVGVDGDDDDDDSAITGDDDSSPPDDDSTPPVDDDSTAPLDDDSTPQPDDDTVSDELSLIGLAPAEGPTEGGTEVVLSGTGFLSGALVFFGDETAEAVVVEDSTGISCLTPSVEAGGAVDVTVTLPGGSSVTLPLAFLYDDGTVPPEVEWCILGSPLTVSVIPGGTAGPLYGRVFVPGWTEGGGESGVVMGEVGYGVPDSPPDGFWNWYPATYSGDVDGSVPGDLAHDEYGGVLPEMPEGTFSYGWRFWVEGEGFFYTWCDADGSDNGFQSEQAGVVTVEAVAGPVVDWGLLQWPLSMTLTTDTDASEPVYGRVYMEGVTDLVGQGPGILAEVGVGPLGSDPTGDGEWSYSSATYNVDVDGLFAGDHANDEYVGTFLNPGVGTWSYLVRFSADEGISWYYGDLNGDVDTFDSDAAGILQVLE